MPWALECKWKTAEATEEEEERRKGLEGGVGLHIISVQHIIQQYYLIIPRITQQY